MPIWKPAPGREWDDLVAGFEMRQVALALDEGRALAGRTLEVVTELRSRGGYRGMPVPWAALERRAGETIASGVANPLQTHFLPIIDRLFPDSVAARMGVQMIAIDSGATEWACDHFRRHGRMAGDRDRGSGCRRRLCHNRQGSGPEQHARHSDEDHPQGAPANWCRARGCGAP